MCDATFKTINELCSHFETHQAKGKCVCTECGLIVLRRSLAKHFNEKHPHKRNFSCPMCEFTCTVKTSVQEHIAMVHTNNYNFLCDICSVVFPTKTDFETHQEVDHGIEPTIDEERTSVKDRIDSHRDVFVCDICGASVKTMHMLKKHKLRHTVQKSTVCRICEKRFFSKNALSAHMRAHTKEKSFQCDQCQKKFAEEADFTVHVCPRVKKSYRCEGCKKEFAKKLTLQQHSCDKGVIIYTEHF